MNYMNINNSPVYRQPTQYAPSAPAYEQSYTQAPSSNYQAQGFAVYGQRPSGQYGAGMPPMSGFWQNFIKNFPMPKFPPIQFPWNRGGGYPKPGPAPYPTPGPSPTPRNIGLAIPDGTRPVNQDYRGLTTDQRVAGSKLSATELGLLHVGGRGLAFTGSREGIYQSYWTVLEKIQNGEEVSERDKQAVLEAAAADQKFRRPSGMSFEMGYLRTLSNITGSENFVNMLQNAPIVRDTGKRLQTPEDINPASQEFVDFQKSIGNKNANLGTLMVLTQWNHDLLDNGSVDGSINVHELAALESDVALVKSPDGIKYMSALAENEVADRSFNNSTAKFFGQAFANAYGTGAAPVTLGMIQQDTANVARQQGISVNTVKQVTAATIRNFIDGSKEGWTQGLNLAKSMYKDHPVMAGLNMAGTSVAAICPYIGGLTANASNAVVGTGNTSSNELPWV